MVFFQKKKKTLENELQKLSELNSSLVFFVSPRKINKIIPVLKKNFNGRKIVFCKEITKFYEEYIRKDIDDLKLFIKEPKGEFTIIISEKIIDKNTSQELSESDKGIIRMLINKISLKEITSIVSQDKNVSKKEIYNYCLKLKNEN